jgi:hypothetical protein
MDELNPEYAQAIRPQEETGYSISKFGHQCAILILTYTCIGLAVWQLYTKKQNTDNQNFTTNSASSISGFHNGFQDAYVRTQNIQNVNSNIWNMNSVPVQTPKHNVLINHDYINSKLE